MAEITSAGIQPAGLTGLVARVEAAFRTALGDDLNEDPETPQGQLSGTLGLVFAEVEELATHVAAGLNLYQATGRQLDDLGTLFGVHRIAGERSSVTATVTGQNGTSVPAGSRARTATGAVFASDAVGLIGSSGTVDVLFRSVDLGPIVAGIGELATIVDVVAGWTAVTNAAAAALGRNVETHAEYRRRLLRETAVHTSGALEAVAARVLDVEGVTDVIVRENATAAVVTVQNIDIAAGAIIVIVEGGADADVAAAIANTRPIGTPTVGDVLVDVPHPGGFTIPTRFRRAVAIPLQVTVTLTVQPGFPSTGLAAMRQNLVDWFTGTWAPGPGVFTQQPLGIGAALDVNRLTAPITAVPGFILVSVAVARTGGGVLGTPDLNERYTLASGAITLTLT